jgi:hypothetical protein
VPANKERYQRLVGKLIYLSHTRPDIAYAISVVSQFMHRLSEDHMDVVTRILRYLKSSPGKGLMFLKNNQLNVDGYTNTDWAGNVSDRKSTSGYFTFVRGNLVTWRTKKQKVVALSSAEAEFRGMAKGLCELLWLKRLLMNIGFTPSFEMNLFCDNKAAIDISHPVHMIEPSTLRWIDILSSRTLTKKLFGAHLSNQKTSWQIYSQRQCPQGTSTTHLTSWA